MKKAILWDLDGTLLYTLRDIAAANNATLTHFGYPTRMLEQYLTYVGNGARNQVRCSIGFEPENFDEICQWYRTYYAAHCNETNEPYEGIKEVAQTLKQQGWLLGIVTNKPNSATQPICQAFFPEFDIALGEQPDTPRKPGPQMVWKVLDELGVQKENAIYVGDSEVDILTAKNSGLPCISVTWGYRTRETLVEAGATHLCSSPSEIPAAVEEICHGE